MTQHNDLVRLHHMLEASQKAVQLVNGKSRSDLDIDEKLFLALTRLLEILGEAANYVPSEIREKNPDIPWREMIGVRNHLIHGYFDVDKDILWSIVTNDLPPLVHNLKETLKD